MSLILFIGNREMAKKDHLLMITRYDPYMHTLAENTVVNMANQSTDSIITCQVIIINNDDERKNEDEIENKK